MAGHRKERPPITGRIATVTSLPFTSDEPADYRVVVSDLTQSGAETVAKVLSEHGYLFSLERRSGFAT